jgi:PAS domain-containing protein
MRRRRDRRDVAKSDQVTQDFHSAAPQGGRVSATMLRLWGAALLLVLAVGVGIALSFWWVERERERDLRIWQDRLGIVADSRADAVGAWARDQIETVSAVGENQAVQLYVADIAMSSPDGGSASDEALAHRQYLENLLLVTADRAGFADNAPNSAVPANVPRIGRAGIAILDAEQRIVAATPDLPPLTPALRGFIVSRTGEEAAALLGPFAGMADGVPTMAFVAPLRDIATDRPSGFVVGIRPVAPDLFARLRQPGATETSAEAMLLGVRDAAVIYLSPLRDGTPALGRTLAIDTPDLAAAWALRNPGGFALRRDYGDVPVLVVSRTVPGTDWILAWKIDRDEALGPSDARLRRMLVGLLLVVAAVSAGIVAVWRHGASRRASQAATQFREMAGRFEQQSNFIRRLTDSQPNGIFIVSPTERIMFANRWLAEATGTEDAEALVGKSLVAVFGPAGSRRHARGVKDAFEGGRTVTTIDRVDAETADALPRILRTEYIPLPQTSYAPAGVLAVEQDITDAIELRERNERLLQQLVEALVGVVDRRDPYAAYQSTRVARVAEAIAREMSLEPVLIDTVLKAASLMNLGKILVPRELLVKTGKLTDEEFALVRDAIGAGPGLIEGVEFDGPVVETLRQMRERVDGSGMPLQLTGDRILITARIVAVANAFVAMVSPRAHRAGMNFDAALDQLFEDCGRAWDRSVVVALANYLDNRGGRGNWAYFANAPVVIDAPE